MSRFQVRKVAVLGAGVMGAQIAAHLVNVKVPVVLFDLPAKEGPKSAIALKAIDNLKKLAGALGVAEDAARITPANYEEHLDLLKDCDLVIEAIAERMDWKLDLYHKTLRGAARHPGVQHLGPVDHQAGRGPARRSSRASAASTSSTRRATCTWWS
jgi:3-hydroxyacyl-CoA dehydrogenase